MTPNKNHVITFIFLQLSVIIYSLAGVCSKYAAAYKFLSIKFIVIFIIEIGILGIYAILWQQIIKSIDIFIAYANKGTSLLWSLLWAIMLFNEKITINNIIGIIIVMIGVILISSESSGGAA